MTELFINTIDSSTFTPSFPMSTVDPKGAAGEPDKSTQHFTPEHVLLARTIALLLCICIVDYV